jgi:hypothetical protein
MGQKPSNTTNTSTSNGSIRPADIRACTPSSGPGWECIILPNHDILTFHSNISLSTVPSFVVLLRGLKITHMDWSSDAVKASIVK